MNFLIEASIQRAAPGAVTAAVLRDGEAGSEALEVSAATAVVA